MAHGYGDITGMAKSQTDDKFLLSDCIYHNITQPNKELLAVIR